MQIVRVGLVAAMAIASAYGAAVPQDEGTAIPRNDEGPEDIKRAVYHGVIMNQPMEPSCKTLITRIPVMHS